MTGIGFCDGVTTGRGDGSGVGVGDGGLVTITRAVGVGIGSSALMRGRIGEEETV
jgi:hypothetical protein